MPNDYKSSSWAVELPSDWSAEEEEDCVSLSAKQGVGALQISAYCRDAEPVTDADLNAFAEVQLLTASSLKISVTGISAVSLFLILRLRDSGENCG